MERVYMQLIIAKRKTIDDVKDEYKEAVLELLKKKNLDGYGNPITESEGTDHE